MLYKLFIITVIKITIFLFVMERLLLLNSYCIPS